MSSATPSEPSRSDLFHVVDEGDGPPTIVLHGGLGLDHTYLRDPLRPLADSARLIHVDLRGNGRSPEPEDWSRVDHSTWIADVDDLRADLGHERVVLFGHSYGGYLAQEYALAFPQRTQGIVLCSTAPAADYSDVILDNARSRGTPEQFDTIRTAFANRFEGDAAAFERTFRTILPLYFHRPTPERIEAVAGRIVYRPAAFNRGFIQCRPAFDVRSRLEEIRVPALILAGRHDWVAPPGPGAERLHAGIADSELVVFEESGHFPFVEEPERFHGVMRSWLRRVARREAG